MATLRVGFPDHALRSAPLHRVTTFGGARLSVGQSSGFSVEEPRWTRVGGPQPMAVTLTTAVEAVTLLLVHSSEWRPKKMLLEVVFGRQNQLRTYGLVFSPSGSGTG